MGVNADAGRLLWLRALVGIFAGPRRAFEIIRDRQPWMGALAVMFALLAVRAYLSHQDLAGALGGREPAGVLYQPILINVAAVLIQLPIDVLVFWRLSLAFGGKARFLQFFSLLIHVYLIIRLGRLVRHLLRRVREAYPAEEGDLWPGFELDRLIPAFNTIFGALFEGLVRFSFFIWPLILLGLGTAAVARLPRRMGLGIAGIYVAIMAALAEGFEGVTAVVLESVRRTI